MRKIQKHHALLALLLLGQTALTPSSAVAAEKGVSELLSLSLAELVDVEVTSVSKRAEKASEAAAAIFVITQEDIKRSGATSIPEVLRLAPGIQVARSGAHQWAVSARGFNDQFANKLLVLMDGRSVYSPLFGGVWWDVQDAMLEDIERIEVIRGPGATLWGANAVNGVINIITRNADATQGNLAMVMLGNEEKGGAYRHGGYFDSGYYRMYGKYSRDDETEFTDGTSGLDKWDMAQAGFRTDWRNGGEDEFTLQGDVYSGEEGTFLNLPSLTSPTLSDRVFDSQSMRGTNVLGRWTHVVNDNSDVSVQAYVDHAKRRDVFLSQSVNTLDLEMQHSWHGSDRHEVVWGVGYRYIYDNLKGSYVSFVPDSRSYDVWNAFVQDKIVLVPEEVFFTIGSKFEHNDYSGVEVQPSARIAWLVDDRQTLWAAVSRSVRTPVRLADDVVFSNKTVPTPLGLGMATLFGNRDLDAETAMAYELGYRAQPVDNLSFDIATFFNDYDKLFTEATATPFVGTSPVFGPHLILPFMAGNTGSGTSYGAEISANWNVSQAWSLSGSYSFLQLDFDGTSAFIATEGESPNHQFNVRSHYAFDHDIAWDVALYYADEIETGAKFVGQYFRLDTHVNWELAEGVELSLVGQNLLDDRHSEFEPFVYEDTTKEIGRSFYGKVTWRF